MISVVDINEGLARTAAVVGTGVIGGPGALAADYVRGKSSAARRDIARARGTSEYDSDESGRDIAYAILGGIPLVGGVSNYLAVRKLNKLENELEKVIGKKGVRRVINKVKAVDANTNKK